MPNFPKDDLAEKAKTLEMLFGGKNFRFGNPLEQFRRDLVAGCYLPEQQQMRDLVNRARRRDLALLAEERQLRLLQQVLASRKRLLESTVRTQITLPVSVQKMETKKFQVPVSSNDSLIHTMLSEPYFCQIRSLFSLDSGSGFYTCTGTGTVYGLG